MRYASVTGAPLKRLRWRRRETPVQTAGRLSLQLATLLGGGVSAQAALTALSDDGSASCAAALEALRHGRSVPVAFAAHNEQEVAAYWAVCEHTGSPIAAALRQLAQLQRQLDDAERARLAAFASPKSTMRLVMVLPLLSLAFGFALGHNPVATLLTTPVGLTSLAVGVTLLGIAHLVSRHLIRRAAGARQLPGFALQLVRLALSAGVSAEDAVRLAVDTLDRLPVDGCSPQELLAPTASIDRLVRLGRDTGAPLGELITAEAERERSEYRFTIAERASKLEVQLLIPLGACVLPAFVALGVVPMMLSVLAQSAIG